MIRIAIWVGLAGGALTGIHAQDAIESKYQADRRLTRLVEFFEAVDAPAKELSAHFLAAADKHGLDWRLLPSISMVESGGGKRYKLNNIFGWDSARRGFATVRDGIYEVASRLANSRLYRNLPLDKLLNRYNSRPEYAVKVKVTMLHLDSTEPLRARWSPAGAD